MAASRPFSHSPKSSAAGSKLEFAKACMKVRRREPSPTLQCLHFAHSCRSVSRAAFDTMGSFPPFAATWANGRFGLFAAFDATGGKKSFAAVASLDCPSGESGHSDKRISGVSYCGADGGSEPKLTE